METKGYKILVVADEEDKSLHEHYQKGNLDGYDLIVSCGDLKASYLEFLVTMGHCPVLYVPGNHDAAFVKKPPEGCICIDEKVYTWNGIRFFGLGGCQQYKPGPYMYTERQMRSKVRRAWWQLFRNRGFDVLVTHAAAYGVDDMEDLPHVGFDVFNELIAKYKPKYHFHGHVHKNYGRGIKSEFQHNGVTVINAYGKVVVSI